MRLTEKELELVAIGASIGGNCIPCLEWHYQKCIDLGFSGDDLKEAVAMAKKVKEVPNQKIYETAEKLIAGTSHDKVVEEAEDGPALATIEELQKAISKGGATAAPLAAR